MNTWSLIAASALVVVGCHTTASDSRTDDTAATPPVDQTKLTGAPVTAPPPATDDTAAAGGGASSDTDERANQIQQMDNQRMEPTAPAPGTTPLPRNAQPQMPPRPRPFSPYRTQGTTSAFPETSFGGATPESRSAFPESSFGDTPRTDGRDAVDGGYMPYDTNIPR